MEKLSTKSQLIDYLLKSDNFKASPQVVGESIRRLEITPTYPIILVGGTNGKGSTCAYLTTILTLAGYRVGTFTSPHVFDYNERIAINNTPIDDSQLTAALQQVAASSATNLGIFKAFTLASHLIFRAQKIDIAIYEVGLGGLKDTTNLFEPTIAAITGVALDHRQQLGNTIEEIGLQKAGIFRQGKPAFFGSLELPASVSAYAAQINAIFYRRGVDFDFRRQQNGWDFISPHGNLYSLPFPALRGHEQLANAALAVAILSELKPQFPTNISQIKQGLLAVKLFGRFQVLPGVPQIVLDTAHNPQAVDIMLQNMLQLPFAKTEFALFAIAADKDWQEIVRCCKDRFTYWCLAPLDSERSCDPQLISQQLQNYGIAPQNIFIYEQINQAFHQTYSKLQPDDRLVCFGSFLMVEAVYRAYSEVK